MTDAGNLFRPQAVEYVARRSGQILLVRPISHAVLTSIFAGVGILIIVFLCTASISTRSAVVGVVTPSGGVGRMVAPQASTVADVVVRVGDVVKAGDDLVVLRVTRSSGNDTDVDSKIRSLIQARHQSQLEERKQSDVQLRGRLSALRDKIRGLSASDSNYQHQMSLQTERLRTIEDNLKLFRDLQAANFVSAADFRNRRLELLDQQLRLSELQRLRLDVQRELKSAEAELQEQAIQFARQAHGDERNLSMIEQELTETLAKQDIHVRAAAPGKIAVLSVKPGQTVVAGQTLLATIPVDAKMEVELYASSRAIGFAKAGMPVQLSYQSFPFERYGFGVGTVLEVADVALRGDEISPLFPALGSGATEPLYRIRVSVADQFVNDNGTRWRLPAGSLVDASLVLEQRRLISLIVDPLNSLRWK